MKLFALLFTIIIAFSQNIFTRANYIITSSPPLHIDMNSNIQQREFEIRNKEVNLQFSIDTFIDNYETADKLAELMVTDIPAFKNYTLVATLKYEKEECWKYIYISAGYDHKLYKVNYIKVIVDKSGSIIGTDSGCVTALPYYLSTIVYTDYNNKVEIEKTLTYNENSSTILTMKDLIRASIITMDELNYKGMFNGYVLETAMIIPEEGSVTLAYIYHERDNENENFHVSLDWVNPELYITFSLNDGKILDITYTYLP